MIETIKNFLFKEQEEYAVRCYDCNRIYAPLRFGAACEIATDHCERHGHSDVHAVRFESVLPLIGTYNNESSP